MVKLVRLAQNPILKPTKNWWENKGVFNPGVATYNSKVYLVYRAWGEDNLSRFGLATSKDGLKFTREREPLIEGVEGSLYERLGIEDVRISQIHDTYYLVYTAASVYPVNSPQTKSWEKSLNHSHIPYRIRISLITTQDFKDFHHRGVIISDFDTKDATLIPEKIKGYYFLIHRHLPSIWLSHSPNLISWKRGHMVMAPQRGWEISKIGVGSQPLKTDLGWLVFYHGVDNNRVYRLGAAILDLENPSKVLKRTPEPIFEPERKFEKEGNVPNVVFTCGVLEKEDYYYIYYGAADRVIGLAKTKKKDLLNYLTTFK